MCFLVEYTKVLWDETTISDKFQPLTYRESDVLFCSAMLQCSVFYFHLIGLFSDVKQNQCEEKSEMSILNFLDLVYPIAVYKRRNLARWKK